MSDQIYELDYVEQFQFCTGLLPEYERRPRFSTYIRRQKKSAWWKLGKWELRKCSTYDRYDVGILIQPVGILIQSDLLIGELVSRTFISAHLREISTLTKHNSRQFLLRSL